MVYFTYRTITVVLVFMYYTQHINEKELNENEFIQICHMQTNNKCFHHLFLTTQNDKAH